MASLSRTDSLVRKAYIATFRPSDPLSKADLKQGILM